MCTIWFMKHVWFEGCLFFFLLWLGRSVSLFAQDLISVTGLLHAFSFQARRMKMFEVYDSGLKGQQVNNRQYLPPPPRSLSMSRNKNSTATFLQDVLLPCHHFRNIACFQVQSISSSLIQSHQYIEQLLRNLVVSKNTVINCSLCILS